MMVHSSYLNIKTQNSFIKDLLFIDFAIKILSLKFSAHYCPTMCLSYAFF